MEPWCVHQTVIPGTSKLFSDYLYDFDQVRRFYGAHFSDAEALGHAIRSLDYPDGRRQRIVDALRPQNGESPQLSELSRPGSVAVMTGQQVGLFSGPAFTIFKALTAVRVAEHLKQQGTPAVPVFWLATEDHDLAEVDHAWVFDQDATPSKIAVTSAVTNGGPVGNVELTDVPIAELRNALGQLPFADEVVKKIATAYGRGATLGRAFHSFLKDILKDFGLLFLDPLTHDVREIAADFMRDVIERVPDLISGLRERNQQLAEAGYHAQVLVEPDTSLLFLIKHDKRVAIRWMDGRFVAKDRSYTPSELQKMANEISPNALLRPVMQDYLLPTATYVGGPAEIAYLAQSAVLYEKLLGRMPVIFPRNSFTLLDARAAKLLDRYGLCVQDVFEHQEKVKSRLASKLVPPGLTDELAAVQSGVSASLAQLESNLKNFDPTLESAAKKSAAKIQYQLEKLGRKTAREALHRDQRATQDAAYLTNLVFPHRRLQERFYSIVPFLAKHGMDLPKQLFEQTQLACPDHMVRVI